MTFIEGVDLFNKTGKANLTLSIKLIGEVKADEIHVNSL